MSTSHVVTATEMAARRALHIHVEGTAHAVATRDDDGGYTVEATLACPIPTDRGGSYAWALRPTHARLAQRLVTAINDGAVFTGYCVATDVTGQTYLHADTTVMTRTLNADLTRKGY